jgi:hypothetical protein
MRHKNDKMIAAFALRHLARLTLFAPRSLWTDG